MVLYVFNFKRCCSFWRWQEAEGNSWSYVVEENTSSRQWTVRICHSLIRSCLPHLTYFKLCLARIQYLPAHEKDQIQDFRNWMESSPETTTWSSPDSPVIGLTENPTANPVNIDMPGTSNEPNPEAPKHTPSTALRVPQMLQELAVVELKGQRLLLLDWYPFSLCHSLHRRS